MSLPSPSEDRGLAHLFELATPELYRRNAFRVLGLEVETETGDARRRQKKLKRQEALGIAARTSGGFLPLKETPSQEDLQQAQQRIQDPVSRLVDEFFWFWKQDEEAERDDALELLREKKNEAAHQVFKQREADRDPAAIHNLAVLYHLTALDYEELATRGTLSESDRKTRDGCWQKCYPRWKQLLDDATTWQRVRARISELDDPRLTHDLVSQIRESLEEMILLVSARLAVGAAERNEPAEATRHVELMKSSGFSATIVVQALRRCLAPIDQRIRNACQKADQATNIEPACGLEQSRLLLAAAVPSIRLFDQMLPADDPLREGMHDAVAKDSLRCIIAYGNTTKDWPGGLQALEELLAQLRPSESMRQLVNENLQTFRENAEGTTCYYCRKNLGLDACAVEVNMHGDVDRKFTGGKVQVTWKHVKITVPRCEVCRDHHAKCADAVETARNIFTGLIFGAFFFLIALVNIISFGQYLSWMIVIGGFILAVWGSTQLLEKWEEDAKSKLPPGTRILVDWDDYPPIRERLRKGWTWGAGPEGIYSDSAATEESKSTPSPTFDDAGDVASDIPSPATSSGAMLPGAFGKAQLLVASGDRQAALILLLAEGLSQDDANRMLDRFEQMRNPTAAEPPRAHSARSDCPQCGTSHWWTAGTCSLCDAPRGEPGQDAIDASLDMMIKLLDLGPATMAQVVKAIDSGRRSTAAALLMNSGQSAEEAKRLIFGWERRPKDKSA